MLIRSLTVLTLFWAGWASAQTGSTSTSAQSEQWQLDVLVFDRDRNSSSAGDVAWRYKTISWPAMLELGDEIVVNEAGGTPQFGADIARQQGVHILNAENSSLRSAASKLNSSGRYQVISQYSVIVRQRARTPAMHVRDRVPLRLVARDTRPQGSSAMDYWLSAPDLAPPLDTERLDGWVQLDHDIHAILKLDLSFLRVLPGTFPVQVMPDGRKEYYRDQIQQYRLQTQRKLQPGTIAYFDHPRIGVLARLTAVPRPQS